MNPVTICIFDINQSKIVTTHSYDMCVTSGEHGARDACIFIYLFIYLLNFAIHTDINKWQGHHNSVHQLLWALDAMDKKFADLLLLWLNSVSLSVKNTNVMIGGHNPVATDVQATTLTF